MLLSSISIMSYCNRGAGPCPLARRAVPDRMASSSAANGSDEAAHVVKEGETLIGIAIQHGLRVSDLKSFNRLFGASLIFPGQKLSLRPPVAQAGSPQPTR